MTGIIFLPAQILFVGEFVVLPVTLIKSLPLPAATETLLPLTMIFSAAFVPATVALLKSAAQSNAAVPPVVT